MLGVYTPKIFVFILIAYCDVIMEFRILKTSYQLTYHKVEAFKYVTNNVVQVETINLFYDAIINCTETYSALL